MVRTSDFQFENVGSIPSNPIMNNLTNINKIFITKNTSFNIEKNIKFNFSFTSLIPPFVLNNVRFSFNSSLQEKKIMIKQSYVLLTWFYYLSFIQQKLDNKNRINFFVLPLNKKKFTLTKAPMAHKNWSKEQYKFQYYKFKINFNAQLKDDSSINSLNLAILFIFLTKKNFPQFETNLFFLKNVNFFFNISDKNFYNYNKFIKNL